jgi:hypothetical protein
LKSSSTLNMQVSFTKSYAAAKYARLLIFAPQPLKLPAAEYRDPPVDRHSDASDRTGLVVVGYVAASAAGPHHSPGFIADQHAAGNRQNAAVGEISKRPEEARQRFRAGRKIAGAKPHGERTPALAAGDAGAE